MTRADALFRSRARATRWGRALVIGAIAAGASCGISSIAPYNPDGGARTGSGGVAAGTGGAPVASGGVGNVATGGQGGKVATGGNAATGGSGAQGSGGRGGQSGAATGGSGGQADAGTGGRGGQVGAVTGGASGMGSGGALAGGGGASGKGGASGTGGGVVPVCQNGDERCSGNARQTCVGGQWLSAAVACGMRQSCVTLGDVPSCVCNADPLCSDIDTTCASPSTIASCAQDSDGCFYQTTTTACTTGSCSVVGATASCCSCTANGPQCVSGSTSQACAGSVVCERSAPTVCADSNWAQWPMPNGPAAVASGASNAASYTDNGDGTVTDKITGLIWQQDSSGPYTWSQAMAYCPTLTLAGHKDWRLPTRIEALSLIDYSVVFGAGLMIDIKYFPKTVDAYYWTSTVLARAPSSQACIVNTDQGGSGYVSMGLTTVYARCVR